MADFRHIECFLLDMDGTIHLSGKAIDGAVDAVNRMRRQGRVLFITNNSSLPSSGYLTKLSAMGFDPSPHELYSALDAAIDFLSDKFGGKRVYAVASDSVKAELLQRGINIVDSAPDVCVLTFDKTLTYEKLEKLCRFISSGAFFIATHPDKTCPVLGGTIPDVGSFLRLIKCATGLSPNVICGKPSATFGRRIMAKTGLKACRHLVVGDRISTDMRLAKNCGFASALVLTGEATRADLINSAVTPDEVLCTIADWDK